MSEAAYEMFKATRAAEKALDAEILKRVKAYLTSARRKFDKNPTASNWTDMLIWSLTYQQVAKPSVAIAYISRSQWVASDVPGFPERFFSRRYPGQPIAELIRS